MRRVSMQQHAELPCRGNIMAAGGHHSGVLVVRDPEQVRKLAGWGLTQNDRASFVGWSQSLISLGF